MVLGEEIKVCLSPLLVFLFGLFIGSFVNVCIYRLPLGQSILLPFSFCPFCKKSIRWYDNIPVLSYIILGGRCRFCKSRISIKYPIYEILTGLILSFIFVKFHKNIVVFVGFSIFLLFLIIISGIDLDHRIIPDELSIPLIFIGFLFSFFNPYIDAKIAVRVLGCIGAIFISVGLFFLISFLGKKIFKKEALGEGDIKLAGGIGAFLGIEGIFYTLFFASLVGTFFSLFLILFGKTKFGSYLPFGPFLSLGALIYLILKL